ncbi:MAG: ABC transporter permease [Anaerolineae bacterium]|nr:ABC transporter permease [Anaerolineae bacterium]
MILKELYRHRKYIFENALSDFRYRYAGTALGVFWNIVNPLLETLIYVIIFQQLLGMRAPGKGDSYALFLIAGLFPWLAFSGLINQGGKAYLRNANKLRVINLPPVVFVATEYCASFIQLMIYFGLMLIIYPVFGGILPGLAWLFLPVAGALLLLLGFMITLIIANLQVLFEDVGELVHHFIHLWRWTMPVMYTLDVFPESWQFWMKLNPPYLFIDMVRGIILNNALPPALDWLIMLGWLVVLGLAAAVIHRRLSPEIRDYL